MYKGNFILYRFECRNISPVSPEVTALLIGILIQISMVVLY